MNIIGFSGFNRAIPFLRDQEPGLPEREYRLTQGHDSAAVLVCNGEIIAAAAQERFSGITHTGSFPVEAIRYCLDQAGLTTNDIDEFAHSFDHRRYEQLFGISDYGSRYYREVLSRDVLLEDIQIALPRFNPDRFVQVDHHLSHAASVYYTSGWDDCLVLVIDAQGEAASASIYLGEGGNLREIGHVSTNDSIGVLYSLITFHLGFDFNADEYKIMGLAPYGDTRRFAEFFAREVRLLPEGGIEIPLLKLNRTPQERMRYLGSRQYLNENLLPERQPETSIGQHHMDVAAALQQRLEQVLFHICAHYAKVTGMRRLAYAGGVSLNCSANGLLRRANIFDEIHIGPAGGDDGSALGAAVLRSVHYNDFLRQQLATPFLGPGSTEVDIVAAFKRFESEVKIEPFSGLDATCTAAAERIAQGEVISWFRGRMEFGARALGHRSILADPRHPNMRERINRAVKKREGFRPFAPAVLQEEAATWFELEPGAHLPYMTVVVRVRSEYLDDFPAITHIDGTARVQTVDADFNASFHRLLQTARDHIGCGMLLNTSFNVKGQPIVATAEEAIATFLKTDIDALFIENYLITRRKAGGA